MQMFRLTVPWTLAISLVASSGAFAALPSVNQDQNGRIITGGSYYNPPGNRTTFAIPAPADSGSVAAQPCEGLK